MLFIYGVNFVVFLKNSVMIENQDGDLLMYEKINEIRKQLENRYNGWWSTDDSNIYVIGFNIVHEHGYCIFADDPYYVGRIKQSTFSAEDKWSVYILLHNLSSLSIYKSSIPAVVTDNIDDIVDKVVVYMEDKNSGHRLVPPLNIKRG